MKFDWLETFELHVPEIDYDHRALLELMRAVQVAATLGDQESLRRRLRRVLKFSERHFGNEEAFLHDVGYENVDRHAQYHRALLVRARDLEAVCAQIQSPAECTQCCAALLGFLIDDVVSGDSKLKSFLDINGYALMA